MNEALAHFFSHDLIFVSRPLIVALILLGLWIALGRAGVSRSTRAGVWLAAAFVLVGWLSTMWTLAWRGAFLPVAGVSMMPLAMFVPLALGLFVLLRSRFVGRILDATNPAWLVGIQAYRMLGLTFLFLWSAGSVPGIFAFPAGIGDFLTGALAIPVAASLASGAAGARSAAIAWNLLGIADFVIAVTFGTLTSPGPLHMLSLAQPNIAIESYPLALVPTFTVPLSTILHGLSLRQLLRRRTTGRLIGAAA